MCRLFFGMNTKNLKNDLKKFIETGTLEKSNYSDNYCIDGYGIIWKTKNEKKTSYISHKPYNKDTQHNRIMSMIDNPRKIWGHIRQKTDNFPNCNENTQPFQYKDIIFMHNGEIDFFQFKKKQILASIDPKLLSMIKGTTDSEHLFYLYITFLMKNNNCMLSSMNAMLDFFTVNDISIVANIICSKDNFLLVTRYTVGNSEKHPYLYIHEDKSSILISTQQINDLQKLIPRRSMFLRVIL